MSRRKLNSLVVKRSALQCRSCRLVRRLVVAEDYSTSIRSDNSNRTTKKRVAPTSTPFGSSTTNNFTQRHDVLRYKKAGEVPVAATSSNSQSTIQDEVVLFQSFSDGDKTWKQISKKKKEPNPFRSGGSSSKDNLTSISSWFHSHQFYNMRKIIENHTVKHLLPNGYPQSVHPAYKRYTIYSFLGNTSSTITMILSTQTLLLAVGVGQQTAAPISATLNWILKDGIGQFGGILFASKISSSSSNSIDADPKKWRMVSSLAMDCAMLTELTTSAFPHYFVWIAGAANIGKNIAFLTASASRAKLHQCLSSPQHAQMVDNLGDITGKATSQSIVASLLGTVIGMGLSPHLLNDLFSVGVGCMALSCVNQFCTYQSLKNIPLKSLNRQRLMLLLNIYFQRINNQLETDGNEENRKHLENVVDAISPERICELESFIPFFGYEDSSSFSKSWLQIGCGLSMIAPNGAEELSRLHHPDEKYVLRYQDVDSNKNNLVEPIVYLTFVDGAKNVDILRGTFQAFAMMELSRGNLTRMNRKPRDVEDCTADMTTWSYEFMKEHMDEFQKSISSAGWVGILDDGVKIMLESETNKRLKFDAL